MKRTPWLVLMLLVPGLIVMASMAMSFVGMSLLTIGSLLVFAMTVRNFARYRGLWVLCKDILVTGIAGTLFLVLVFEGRPFFAIGLCAVIYILHDMFCRAPKSKTSKDKFWQAHRLAASITSTKT